jgi:alternative ribosome-rescue factor
MGKAKKLQYLKLVDNTTNHSVDTGRGQINSNALAALVTSKLFKQQVVASKKGKGSFNRKVKHSGRESYPIAA